MNPMKLVWLISVLMSGLTGLLAQTPNAALSPWEQPAASLADEVAGILGPGQAHLTIRNLSRACFKNRFGLKTGTYACGGCSVELLS
jgi:hypothetical protein